MKYLQLNNKTLRKVISPYEMSNWARRIVRSNPLSYRVWLQLRNGYRVRLPDSHTDLHVDGFQRSGNTYASLVLRKLYPDRRIVSNLHAIASLRQAMKLGVPTIVLVRDPEQAILSSLVRRVDGKKENYRIALSFDLHGYYDYYAFALEHQTFLTFALFERLTEDSRCLAVAACQLMRQPMPSRTAIEDATSYAMDILSSDNRRGGMRNLFSSHKEKLKQKYLKQLDEEELQKCRSIYEKIVKLSV